MKEFYLAHPKEKIFDGSCLKDAKTCWRLAYWRWIRGWQFDTPNVHLHAGAKIHEAVAHYHRHGSVEAAIEVLREGWEGIEMHITKNPASMVRLFLQWVAFIKTETQARLVEYKMNGKPIPAVEVEFAVDMPNGCVFSGRIDSIFEQQGLTFVDDLKHTSRKSSRWKLQYANNFSLKGYCYVTDKVLGNCNGATITLLHCVQKPDPPVRDVVYEVTPQGLRDFEDDFCRWSTAWLNKRENSSDWPQSDSDITCSNKFGTCPYLDLCIEGEAVAESVGLVRKPVERKK